MSAIVPAIPSIFHYAIRINQLHTSSALNSRIQALFTGVVVANNIGRNQQCPCGRGKKFKI
ncbi:MAG TPA: hypothetical protein ENI97_15560 [Gammaproteobacteria bacterium]|nr:hypothetical protein [Gammaproteobacteria bacterium]